MSALQFATDLQLVCGTASGAEDFETLQAQGNQVVCFGQLLASMIGQQCVGMSFLLAAEEVCVLGTLSCPGRSRLSDSVSPAGESHHCTVSSEVSNNMGRDRVAIQKITTSVA